MYRINDNEFETARETAEWLVQNMDIETAFDEMLDNCYSEIEICGYYYFPSQAFYNTDATAYNCARSEYEDSLISEYQYTIESLEPGDTEYCGEYSVWCE